MNVGSLFAGIGGFDLAAQRAGFEITWQAEIDGHCSRVLAHHWPEVQNHGDVTTLEDPAPVDVLAGGFPCQDYSLAGERRGLAGDRGAMWWQFHRLIALLRPTWVIGENVHGILSSRGGRDFATIVDSLVELGYGVTWRLFDSRYFGVAQGRRRVFIVGRAGGEPRPAVLALGQGVAGTPRPGDPPRPPDPRGARAGAPFLVEPHTGQGADLKVREALIAPALSTNEGEVYDRGVRIAFAQNQRNEFRLLDRAVAVAAERWGTAKGETLIVEPDAVRRLTPSECEQLQGFPAGWTDVPGNPYTRRLFQLGNAVTVPVAEWILRRLADD